MDGWDVLEQAAELARSGQAFALATVVWRQGPSSGQRGSRAIITASGELFGWIGGACAEPVVIREAQQVITEGVPRLLLLGPPGKFGTTMPEGITAVPISCQSEGSLEVYVEPVLPTPHLVIVGRSPMAQTLADLARTLRWRTVLLDGPDFSAADADERSMVVIATQGHGDEEAVAAAVAARPAYLGLVGSARRGASVLGYLADRGVPTSQLGRVRVPAGLDLGPTSHREIAVSILAELVQLRASGALAAAAASTAAASTARTAGAGRTAGTASTARTASTAATSTAATSTAATSTAATAGGPGTADAVRSAATAGSAEPAESAAAVDPVCGMTVGADPSGYLLEHDGVTYQFCCAGCRRAFEKDPAAYVKRETRC